MLLPDWQYFIIDQKGRCYAVQNGLMTLTAERKPLQYTPDGWEQISIIWERRLAQIGYIRTFGLPLNFVMDGSKILRQVFYAENMESQLYLLIQKLTLDLTDTSYNFRYKYFYRGELDFSTLKHAGLKVSIGIAEGGISKL